MVDGRWYFFIKGVANAAPDTDSGLNGPEVRCPTLRNNDKKVQPLGRDKCAQGKSQMKKKDLHVNPERILFSGWKHYANQRLCFPRSQRTWLVLYLPRTVSEQAALSSGSAQPLLISIMISLTVTDALGLGIYIYIYNIYEFVCRAAAANPWRNRLAAQGSPCLGPALPRLRWKPRDSEIPRFRDPGFTTTHRLPSRPQPSCLLFHSCKIYI